MLFHRSVRLSLSPARCLALAWMAVGLAGCSTPTTLTNMVPLYRIDIIQGNVVTREQVSQLVPGLTRTQVKEILGSPLMASVFHAQRWDYVFTIKRPDQPPQQRKVTVLFNAEGTLDKVEADELPTEEEFVASIDPKERKGRKPVLQATEEELKAFEARHPRVEPEPEPVRTPPILNYPPLKVDQP